MNEVSTDMFRKLVRAMEPWDGGYTFDDIMERIYDGRFQSFSHGDTWLITQVNVYPHNKFLEIILIVGNAKDFEALDQDITKFAKEIDASKIVAVGRDGFVDFLPEGWKKVATAYAKELKNVVR